MTTSLSQTALTQMTKTPLTRHLAGSEDNLTRSNGLLKRLREGDSVAQIISSLSEFASLPTARIDESPMEA